ncbi:hypothetical protein LDL59_05045 [Kaistella anthropi]|nr:hypothetical protein [Kaistella anthropi]
MGQIIRNLPQKPYDPKVISAQVRELYADPYIKTRKGIFEYILGGSVDTKLLEVRVFDEATKKSVYALQTKKAIDNKISNCPLCTLGHDSNKTRIYKFTEMDADHVSAWSKGVQLTAVIVKCSAKRTIGRKGISKV